MRTLFAKTLLWSLGSVVLTMVGIVAANALGLNFGARRPSPMRVFLAVQLEEARHAYETGGRAQLEATLNRFQTVTRGESILTDANGRDLVTGQDHSDLVRAGSERPRLPFMPRNRAAMIIHSRDGKYWYFLQTERDAWIGWFIQPRNYLVILCFLVLLSWAFARHLTNPVRKLKNAVDCFGRGDFATRVDANRKDELGQLGQTFNVMADRIQTLLTAERRLLLDISHELRSPLARLGVAVELARGVPEPEVQLNRIQKEADRLNALVGELLQVTRVEGDPSKRKLEPVRLDELVQEVVDDCSIEAETRGTKLVFSQATPVTLSGDRELLRRAVENVVRNAIRYAPQGTPVELTLKEDGHIVIRDYGPGVPEQSLNHIFDAFYRVDSDRNRNSGGVGLGLAIARRAVELHNGHITARNAGPGLLVDVQLPT
jgi:signal transduction histidine kinase